MTDKVELKFCWHCQCKKPAAGFVDVFARRGGRRVGAKCADCVKRKNFTREQRDEIGKKRSAELRQASHLRQKELAENRRNQALQQRREKKA